MNSQIIVAITEERSRQDSKWGGVRHDLTHNHRDWTSFIVKQLGKVEDCQTDQNYREIMVKVAALAVAAIESSLKKTAHPKRLEQPFAAAIHRMCMDDPTAEGTKE